MSDRTLVEYLDFRLGAHAGNGPEYRWFCPMCIDLVGSEASKQKLHVNTERGVGHCYRCEFKFNQFEQLFRSLNNGVLRIEEARLIRREVKLPSNVATESVMTVLHRDDDDRSARLKPVRVPRDAFPLWLPKKKNPLLRRPLDYLHGRGITDEQIERHQISYCVGGRYAGYLVFPVLQNGEQVYFTTRFVGQATDGMKSNNPPKAAGFHSKSTCLLNHDGAAGQKIVAIVEGPFDMMAWGSRAVALMGKAISDDQVALVEGLCRSGTREIVVSLDSDAGKHSQDIYSRLIGRVPKVSVLLLPDGDPHDNRDKLDHLLKGRGAPGARDLVLSRYRFGPLVKRIGKSPAQRV